MCGSDDDDDTLPAERAVQVSTQSPADTRLQIMLVHDGQRIDEQTNERFATFRSIEDGVSGAMVHIDEVGERGSSVCLGPFRCGTQDDILQKQAGSARGGDRPDQVGVQGGSTVQAPSGELPVELDRSEDTVTTCSGCMRSIG
jgi:hypothetical protein